MLHIKHLYSLTEDNGTIHMFDISFAGVGPYRLHKWLALLRSTPAHYTGLNSNTQKHEKEGKKEERREKERKDRLCNPEVQFWGGQENAP